MKLPAEVDKYMPTTTRDLNKPLLLPVNTVHLIPGRATVVTGRLKRGTLKKGQEFEFVGYSEVIKSTITGIAILHKILKKAHAGDQLEHTYVASSGKTSSAAWPSACPER